MNLFSLPAPLPESETENILYQTSGLRITRIISTGQCSPPDFWYDQEEDEWLTLLQGKAMLEYDNGTYRELRPGDTLLIPRHVRHRVAGTSAQPPCIWLCVYSTGESNF